ncbi:MAG: lactonase family protein [Anaerolineaceae bacterium]|nr:lactonase family protein [Oscillospiraceae bacterium]MBQ6481553.1 lactonase family protein [Anaerolineaceae bacterium]
MRTVYIASRDEKGGILRCALSEDGQLSLLDTTPVDRPAYLCRDKNKLYVLLREPFQLMSGLSTYQINPDGALSLTGELKSTHGLYTAHLYAREGKVWVANYIDGTVALLQMERDNTPVQDKVIAFTGSGPDKKRQLSSHPHCIVPTPDGKYLCVNDLGTDRIYVMSPELELIFVCQLPSGCGPRHLVFSRDGTVAFSSNEMGSSVSVLRYLDGTLKHIYTVSTLPAEYQGISTAAGILLSEGGNQLYVSNRGHDSVSVFRVAGEELTLEGFIPCFGISPREIALAGDFLLCGNERSDNITVFSLRDGIPSAPVCDYQVKMPWCIIANQQ